MILEMDPKLISNLLTKWTKLQLKSTNLTKKLMLLKKPFGAWAEGENEEFGNKEQLRKKESSSENF